MADLKDEFDHRRNLVVAMILAVLIAAVLYRINRAFGNFLSDEGYLWYGVQRVLAGEVPIRDFMSYEVGRYYFCALLMYPFQTNGLLALRAVLGVVAALSLSVSIGLVGAHARETRAWRLLPAAALFALWLGPRHKVFDIAISALLILGIYRLLRGPSVARFFQLGLITGIAATIGQNHGAYALVACGIAFGLLLAGTSGAISSRTLLAWASGIIVGYLPVLLTVLFAHGYLHAEIDALRYLLFEYKGTNLSLPIPWPWKIALHHSSHVLKHVLVSGFFLAIPLSLLAAFVAIIRRIRRGIHAREALFVAAWAVAVPYADVAFSRADVPHLAQAILPFLLLALSTPAFLGGRRCWQPLLAGSLLLVSLPVALSLQPRMAQRRGRHLVPVTVQGDRVMVQPFTRDLLALANREHANGMVIAVPYYPGLMAALGEKSPLWEIYPLFPRGTAFQAREIKRLRASAPAAILVSNSPLDGQRKRRFSSTHSVLYRYIEAHYKEKKALGGRIELFVPKRQETGALRAWSLVSAQDRNKVCDVVLLPEEYMDGG